MVDLLAAAATSVGAVSTAAGSVVSDALQRDLVLAQVESVLAECAQPRIGMGAPILLVEVLGDQPVHCDTTMEAAARLLLGHTNSADGETNQ